MHQNNCISFIYNICVNIYIFYTAHNLALRPHEPVSSRNVARSSPLSPRMRRQGLWSTVCHILSWNACFPGGVSNLLPLCTVSFAGCCHKVRAKLSSRDRCCWLLAWSSTQVCVSTSYGAFPLACYYISITLLLKVWSEDQNWTSSKVIPMLIKSEALF